MSALKWTKLFTTQEASEFIEGNPIYKLKQMDHHILTAMSSASTWSAGDRLKPWTPEPEMLVPAALKRGAENLHKSAKDQAEREDTEAKPSRDELAQFETERMLAWTETLKPDQRLHRDELARWCAVMRLESAEFVLPAPVGLETKVVAECLADIGLRGLTQQILHTRLKNCPGWLEPARVAEGKQGGASALWNPAAVAIALVRKGFGTVIQMRGEFERNPTLKGWLEQFERMADSPDLS
jgi:hypothetical protein